MKKYLSGDFDTMGASPLYDELPLWSAPFGLRLLDLIEYKPGITALDIGFGTGFPLTEIAMRLGEGSIVYGLDPWKEMIRLFNKKTAQYEISNIRILEGVAEAIPLESNSLDLITGNNCLNNVSDMDKALAECSRVLKSGGQIVQTMNTDKTMFEFYTELERVLSEMKLKKEIGLMHQHIYEKRRPLDEIIEKFRKNGFVIKDLEQDQFNYKFSDGTAMLNHYFIRIAFMNAWKDLLPGDKIDLIFDAVETRLNEQALITGGLKLSIPFAVINAIKK